MNKIYLLLFILVYSTISNAGVFRDRDRFNEDAGGFWMKGRCSVPKNGLGVQDDARVFKDLGCIVKNRKGKRRPSKSPANIIIRELYFGLSDRAGRREWTSFEGLGADCTRAPTPRCDSKVFRFPITADTSVRVIGSMNCIIGYQGAREDAHAFISTVGHLPPRDQTVPGTPNIWNDVFQNFRTNCY